MSQGLGLDDSPDKPLVAVITRLVPQKGIHLIKAAMYRWASRLYKERERERELCQDGLETHE